MEWHSQHPFLGSSVRGIQLSFMIEVVRIDLNMKNILVLFLAVTEARPGS